MNGVNNIEVSSNHNVKYTSGENEGSQYCVLWNNYHRALVSTFATLRKEGELLDCTLACTDGGKVHAHKLILAACSNVCRDFVKVSVNLFHFKFFNCIKITFCFKIIHIKVALPKLQLGHPHIIFPAHCASFPLPLFLCLISLLWFPCASVWENALS